MAQRQDIAPGTVSRILWHFTGGPTWDSANKKQDERPKPSSVAYEHLVEILRSRELQVSKYSEFVKVILLNEHGSLSLFDDNADEDENGASVPVELTSAPVCCLADIPIAHLSYHAKRYGKFAIGFHRDAAIQHGFNPVLYTLHDTDVVRSIYEGVGMLRLVDADLIHSHGEEAIDHAQEMADLTLELEKQEDLSNEISASVAKLEIAVSELESASSDLQRYLDDALGSLRRFLAFIKTFDLDEFGTVYCEREWRSVTTFGFSSEDIAMIAIPKRAEGATYFEMFIDKEMRGLGLSAKTPVVPWEDLVEH